MGYPCITLHTGGECCECIQSWISVMSDIHTHVYIKIGCTSVIKQYYTEL
jgi:hypothetical protein